ncbi:MAG TPA: hypothetical protein VNX28_13735 [Gemmataceae bacterium]|jgi:hypothetical protein|nr:hypothetical protein [Gemmataceae bacterium]
MKNFGLFGGVGVLAFVLAGYHAGLFRPPVQQPEVGEVVPSEEKKEAKRPAKSHFPRDIARCARAEPVPQAAAYDPSAKFHRMAILKTNGALYQDWQDKLKQEWQAETVEDTSLVIVVGAQKKVFIEIIPYPNGAPPISRYKFELEASVVEAKTGRVLANRLFINMPRNIVRIETWDTTALGSPVEFRTVFNWAVAGARSGFPPIENPTPIVNVVN